MSLNKCKDISMIKIQKGLHEGYDRPHCARQGQPRGDIQPYGIDENWATKSSRTLSPMISIGIINLKNTSFIIPRWTNQSLKPSVFSTRILLPSADRIGLTNNSRNYNQNFVVFFKNRHSAVHLLYLRTMTRFMSVCLSLESIWVFNLYA